VRTIRLGALLVGTGMDMRREEVMPDLSGHHNQEIRDAIVVAASVVVAVMAHWGRMLYENRPIPVRKAAGASILSAMAGAAVSSVVVSYLNPPALVVVSSCVIIGFIGGPAVVEMAARFGRRYAVKVGNGLVGASEGEKRDDS
jgi:hypothetical protein